MKICKQCGVELDEGMETCPLCTGFAASEGFSRPTMRVMPPEREDDVKTHLMRRVLWQITAVLLVSGVIATLIINLAVLGEVTWAIYPITICLIVFAYASIIALWRTRFIFHLLTGWVISSLLLLLVNLILTTDWILSVAWPVVSAINIIGMALYFLIRNLKTKGLNVFALVIVSLAALSLVIESVISIHLTGSLHLGWSVIVAACLLPVTAAILFMYFRTRRNSELQKIFHT